MRLPQLRTLLAVSFGLVIAIVGLPVDTPASAQSGSKSAIRPTAITKNWAGYVVRSTATEPPIADFANGDRIDGAWRVPNVDCSSRKNSAVSIWVGLGGYPIDGKLDTLYQTGTTATCHKGTVTYSAWWEVVLGDGPHQINEGPVHPGDHMWASIEINHLANEVEITLANDGQGDDRGWVAAYRTSVPWNGKYPLSGECIVERPSNTDRLANFGKVYFVSHVGSRECGIRKDNGENYFQLNTTSPRVTTYALTMLRVTDGKDRVDPCHVSDPPSDCHWSSPLATVSPRSDTDPIAVTWQAER